LVAVSMKATELEPIETTAMVRRSGEKPMPPGALREADFLPQRYDTP